MESCPQRSQARHNEATPEFLLIGLYRIVPTLESISVAARYHCGYDHVLDESGVWKEEVPWDQFQDLGLVELEIRGRHAREHIDSISHGDQAAYDEFYLDGSGANLIPEEEAFAISEPRRVCFFLHFINPNWPLKIYGVKFKLPSFAELPERLKPLTHYLPVD